MFCVLSVVLAAVVAALSAKIAAIHHSADELRMQFGQRIQTDTNVGIDISSSDKKMKQLAADLDRQLKLFRKQQIQYTLGDREVKKAVTNISHDLRTPLTAIYGYLALIKQEELPDSVLEYLKVLENRVDALKTLSEELFRYSVVLSVDACGQREEVCLNAVLEECLAGYYGAIIKAGIQPDIQITVQPVKRMLNQQALARVFSNIIGNAVKYSDGDFQVILEPDGVVHFYNQAQNLDPIHVGRLFDRFYTVEAGHSATGLGLSIARTLTEEMQGQVEAELIEGRLHIFVSFPEKI